MLKASQIAAKVAARLFFILVLVAAFPFMGDGGHKLDNIYLTTPHKWILIFPCILLLGFAALLVYCTIKKYKEIEYNWLLVLNTAILLAYGITVYVRIWHLIGPQG